ncbi:MAG: trigger factor [Bacteroidales bacterium]
MDITKENKDDLNAVLKVRIVPEDYQERVDKVVKDYKKKAKMNGFRPGKVPESLVRKMYGRDIKIDEIHKLIQEKLSEYIKNENLEILGKPLPSKEEQKSINWDKESEFEFAFDIAMAPEFDLEISEEDKVPYYTIKVSDELIDKQVGNYLERFGEFKPIDSVQNKDEIISAHVTELDEEGNPKEGGIVKEDATISLQVIKEEEIKNKFEGAQVGDEIDVDLKKAFPSNTEISSMLNIDKEEAENVEGQFRISITEIKQFEKAEQNQELFDKIYGEGNVTSEEEFRQKIKEEIEEHLKPESKRKLTQDIKNYFVEKINPELPIDFLKRWLKETQQDENFSEEDIEKEIPRFEEELKWDLIKNKIIKENHIQVDENEVLELAKEVTALQFQQYGLGNLPDEQLEQYAPELLKKEEDRRKFYERKYEEKVIDYIKERITLEEKEVTSEEFQEMIQEDQNKQTGQ